MILFSAGFLSGLLAMVFVLSLTMSAKRGEME